MKKNLCIVFSLLFLNFSSQAAIDGFAMPITASLSYTVPAGKVLILQQVSSGSIGQGPWSFGIGATNSTGVFLLSTVYIPSAITNGIYKFPSALKLPSGTTVSMTTSSSIVLYGLIVDVADMSLFTAGISTFSPVSIAQNTLSGELQLPTSDPALIRIQSSTNMVDWVYDSTVRVQAGSSKDKVSFSVPVAGPGHYYRALVVRQPGA